MQKKKIIILSNSMEIGGAERALLGLLNSLDYEKYQVDLFLGRQVGELLKYIPENIKVLPQNRARYLAIPMYDLLQKVEIRMLYGRLKAKYLAKKKVAELGLQADNQVELTYSHQYTWKYIEAINPEVEYELAISFLTPHYICMNKVRSKKKIAWIHTDYSTIDIDVETELKMWEKYNHIVSISDKCTEAFLAKFQSMQEKIIRIDNIVSPEMIKQQAGKKVPLELEMPSIGVKLLTVGRFSSPKKMDEIPKICKKIRELGLDVKWYLIGFGGDEQLIRENIIESGMQEHVIILGKRENPYPYIRACDIYVQPSRYEGKAIVVQEAQILEKPVIITAFPTATSQLINGVDGIIVPMDISECADGIAKVILDRELQNRLIKNMQQIKYGNEKEIGKIYSLIS